MIGFYAIRFVTPNIISDMMDVSMVIYRQLIHGCVLGCDFPMVSGSAQVALDNQIIGIPSFLIIITSGSGDDSVLSEVCSTLFLTFL